MKATSAALLAVVVALIATCSRAAALDIYRLLQADYYGQKIGSRTYSAEGVGMIVLSCLIDLTPHN